MTSSSRREIEAELRRAIEVDGEKELRAKGREFAREVMEYAKSISPFDETDAEHYRDQFKLRARNGRGKLPSWRISNTSRLAHIVEFGAYERPQGGDSPDHLVFTKTAFRYGGKVDGLGEDDEL